jgi:Bacterial PH domain
MARPDPLLAPGEHVHLVLREHRIVLLAPFLRAAATITACAALALWAAGWSVPVPLRALACTVCAAVAARALVRLGVSVARWQARTLVITDRKAVLVRGRASRRATALPLQAIHDLEIVHTGAGRLLHYGGLVVNAGGRRDLLFGLRRLPDPDLVFGLLVGLADELAAPAPAPLPRRFSPGGVPLTVG